MQRCSSFRLAVFILACAIIPMSAQTLQGSRGAVDRITQPVNNEVAVLLAGNVHPLARPEFDQGSAPRNHRMERMVLVLAPDAAQERALEALFAAQQDPQSPLYRRWLTPEDFGKSFGISERDLDQVVTWLSRHGFEVEPVAAGRREIIFSGTAEDNLASSGGDRFHFEAMPGKPSHYLVEITFRDSERFPKVFRRQPAAIEWRLRILLGGEQRFQGPLLRGIRSENQHHPLHAMVARRRTLVKLRPRQGMNVPRQEHRDFVIHRLRDPIHSAPRALKRLGGHRDDGTGQDEDGESK